MFLPGEVRQCIQIDILDDNELELDEEFFVDLVLGDVISTTKIVIEDDDGGKISNKCTAYINYFETTSCLQKSSSKLRERFTLL